MRRRFEVYFECDNASFDDNPGLVAGIKRVLKTVRWMVGNNGELVRGAPASHVVYDDNGNTIGRWRHRVMPDKLRVTGVVGLWYGDGPPPDGWRFMFDTDKEASVRFVTNTEV